MPHELSRHDTKIVTVANNKSIVINSGPGKSKQFTINYKDPFFKIKLSKSKNLIISKRDTQAKFFSE